jgi:hypothetical protein
MLYLPPGIAHYGVAEDPCLTYSVGMRAPAMAEMLSDFSGFLAERMGEDQRYSDAGMTTARRAGEIDDSAIEQIEQALKDSLTLEPSLLRRWWGCFITRYRMAHEIQPRPKPVGSCAIRKADRKRRQPVAQSMDAPGLVEGRSRGNPVCGWRIPRLSPRAGHAPVPAPAVRADRTACAGQRSP